MKFKASELWDNGKATAEVMVNFSGLNKFIWPTVGSVRKQSLWINSKDLLLE